MNSLRDLCLKVCYDQISSLSAPFILALKHSDGIPDDIVVEMLNEQRFQCGFEWRMFAWKESFISGGIECRVRLGTYDEVRTLGTTSSASALVPWSFVMKGYTEDSPENRNWFDVWTRLRWIAGEEDGLAEWVLFLTLDFQIVKAQEPDTWTRQSVKARRLFVGTKIFVPYPGPAPTINSQPVKRSKYDDN